MNERVPRRRWRLFKWPSEIVEGYLTDDELVYYEETPDLKAWVCDNCLDVVIAFVVVIIMVQADEPRVTFVGVIGEVWLVSTLVWRVANKAFTRYVLTDTRALFVSGVLRRDHEWISWRKVTDVSVHRSLTDRWFGTATIQIQSANEMSKFKAMDDVPNPVSFAETIVDLVNSAR